MARTEQAAADDVDQVSALIVSGSYCVACIARKAAMSVERLLEAFRRIEDEWREPLIDTARCGSCHAMTTTYSLRLP